MNIRKILGNGCLAAAAIIMFAMFAVTWLSTPLEVFDQATGECLYQLETDWRGEAVSQVPCGTYGELAVQRVSEIFM